MPLSNKAAFFINAVQNRPSGQPFLWLACPCELCMHRVHGFACNPACSKGLKTLATPDFRGFTSCIKTSELSQQRAGGENCARRGVVEENDTSCLLLRRFRYRATVVIRSSFPLGITTAQSLVRNSTVKSQWQLCARSRQC